MQNIHRRSTVPRIPTEQAESSTESEEEDDRVLDGKVVSPLYGQQLGLKYITTVIINTNNNTNNNNKK